MTVLGYVPLWMSDDKKQRVICDGLVQKNLCPQLNLVQFLAGVKILLIALCLQYLWGPYTPMCR